MNETCGKKVYNKTLLSECSHSDNEDERLKVGTFLPTLCKIHEEPRSDTYFHIVDDVHSTYYLSLNASDPRSVISIPFTG